MSDERKKIADRIESVASSLGDIVHRVNDTGNMYLSVGSITSVADDRTTCDILLLDKMQEIKNVRSIIPCSTLNSSYHLVEEDLVLVMHNYPSYSKINIIQKLQNTINYADDTLFKVTNRLDFSKYAA